MMSLSEMDVIIIEISNTHVPIYTYKASHTCKYNHHETGNSIQGQEGSACESLIG